MFTNHIYLIYMSKEDLTLNNLKWLMPSSSSRRAASTDIPDPLSPRLPIIHRLRQVFRVTSSIITELLYVCSSRSSCFGLAMCGGTHHLRSRPCFSSSVQHVWFVQPVQFSRQVVGDRTVGALWGVATRTCLILLAKPTKPNLFFLFPNNYFNSQRFLGGRVVSEFQWLMCWTAMSQ